MVAIVTNSNAYSFGIAKQASGTAVAGTAAYSLPVYSADLTPTYELNFVEVTDASSIQGDPYKGPTSWTGSVETPMLGASLGAFLVGMWPTDTPSGTAPAVHTFTGLGGTQPFVTLFDNFTNAGTTNATQYGNGLVSELEFTATQDGGPGHIKVTAVGATPAIASWTATTADVVGNGYFELQHASASVKQDPDTPNSSPSTPITNVRDVTINISRNVTAEPTVDSLSVVNLSQGKVVPSGSMTFLYSTWDEYKATYFGSTSGSTVSATMVYGALLLTYGHSVQSTWAFTLYIPKVQFYVPRPSPNPAGDALTQAVTLNIADPTSGDHVQPVLSNGVATAYSA